MKTINVHIDIPTNFYRRKTRIHNDLVHKQTLNDLASFTVSLARWLSVRL